MRSNSARWLGSMVGVFTLAFLTLGATTLMTIVPAPAYSQEVNDPADFEVPKEPAAPEDVPVQEEEEEGPPTNKEQSVLAWTFEALGWEYTIAFLVLSFSFVALFVMNVMHARRENVLPAHLIEDFEAQLAEKHYQEAYELARNDDSFLGQVLAAGLAKLNDGYEQAIEAMQEVAEDENMKLDHRLSYIGLIGSISPLVGLLGTVHGMIMSFQVIANSATTPKPYELAKGISTALFTTLVGLLLAIPAIATYNILRNRVARLVLEVGIVSGNLMSRFQKFSPKK